MRAEVAEAAANQRAAEERLKDFDANVDLEVRQRAADVASAEAAIAASEVGVRSAAEARRVLADRFSAGVATNTDVLDAQVALLQAELDRTRALAEYTSGCRTAGSRGRTMTEEHAIVVRDLTRRFGRFIAVDRISFDVERGEIFGFLGANGAGKSTTIRMLCGLLKPTSGTAVVGGIDVGRDPEAVKRRIGYMSQKFSLYEALTVDQNIRFWGALYGLDDDRIARRRKFVLEMAGLAGRENTKARELAGGWRQRLALGCAILHEPRLLFLDEPTGGVDPVSRRQFWRLIEDLSRSGVTILVTTHYLDEAEHCHRIAIINAGKLAALGTSHELKQVFADRPIVEIHSSRPVDVMKVLDRMDEVQKTTVFGTAVHAVLKPGRIDVATLHDRLEAQGLEIRAIDRVMPSLEDVFLDVVERAS